MARVYEGERAPDASARLALERLIYRLAASIRRTRCDWTQYALAMLLVQPARLRSPCMRCSGCRHCCRSTRRLGAVSPRLVVQHRGELRHQYQLAGLRRRNHDELSHADARAHRAELRLGGDRHGGARRADPRLRAQAGRAASAISGSISRAPRSTSCCRCRSCSRSCWCPGRGADLRGLRDGALVEPVSTSSRRWPDGQPLKDKKATGHREGHDKEQTIAARARPRRRSRSSSSAPTAAASSTSTRRIRSRTRRRCRTSSRCWRSC